MSTEIEIDLVLTQRVIDIIMACTQCIESVKQVPCDDYKMRFGAWLRVRHGIKMQNTVDWVLVAETVDTVL